MRAGVVASGLHTPPPSFAMADTGGAPSNNPPRASLSWYSSGTAFYGPRQSNRGTDLDGRDLIAMLSLAFPEGADVIITRSDMPGDHWRASIRTDYDPSNTFVLTVFVAWADPKPTTPAPAGTRWTFTYS